MGTLQLENLAFGGCGVRNAAYVGALFSLEAAGLLTNIKAVSGTSAGSIIATLMACRYSPLELRDAVYDLDFKRLTDGSIFGGAVSLFEHYGWHKASYIETALDALIEAKTGKAQTTFRELQAWGGRELKLVGTNLTRRTSRVFPDPTTWDLPIVKAVRISIAIPLFFEARALEGDLYVDGGVLWNLPVEVFDEPNQVNAATLGLLVQEEKEAEAWPIHNAHDYVSALFGSLLRAQDADLEDSPADRSRVVTIGDLGISAVNFEITQEQKAALVNTGRQTMDRYLSQRGIR